MLFSQLLKKGTLVFAGLAFAVGATEVGLRVFPAAIPDSVLSFIPANSKLISFLTPQQQWKSNWYLSPAEQDDPTYGFRYSYRNTNGYDENGFRNRSNHSHVDVIALGDSFVHGGDMPDGKTWLQLIEDAHDITILSLGVGGWSAFQEERAYSEFGLERGARLVIQVFYINDIGEIEIHEDWEQTALSWTEYVLQQTAGDASNPIKHFIRNNSFIGNFVWEASTRSFARLTSKKRWTDICPSSELSRGQELSNDVDVGILKFRGGQPEDVTSLSKRSGFGSQCLQARTAPIE